MNNQNKCTLVFLIQPANNIHEENKILLLKRKNDPAKDTYTGVGGHIELNESPKQCALRETFEETGLELNDIKILGYYNKINSYIGYRLIKNLSNKFKEDETIKAIMLLSDTRNRRFFSTYRNDQVKTCDITNR